MKKTHLLLVITVIIIGIYSCKKESKSPTPKDLIVGTWLGVSRVDTSFVQGQVNDVSLSYYDKNQSVFNYVFNADGTGTSGDQPKTKRTFNYDLKNSKIEFFNILNLYTGAVPPISRELRKLTSTELVVRIDITYTNHVNGASVLQRMISDFHYVHP